MKKSLNEKTAKATVKSHRWIQRPRKIKSVEMVGGD